MKPKPSSLINVILLRYNASNHYVIIIVLHDVCSGEIRSLQITGLFFTVEY